MSVQCSACVYFITPLRYQLKLGISNLEMASELHYLCLYCVARWRSSRVLDLRSIGRRFKFQPPGCLVQPWASGKHTSCQYNLVQASGWWCLVARKVTVDLVSHWPRITDISGSPPTGSRPRRGRWAPAYALLWTMVDFIIPYTLWGKNHPFLFSQ